MVSVAGPEPRERAGSLAEVAYEHIRAELLKHGETAFGGRLVEQQVAAELSLSRTPVREALRRLHLAGWLDALPGGGFAARRSTMRDVLDTFELRLLLEPLAASLVARRLGGQAAGYLSGSTEEDQGVAIHLAIASACGVNSLTTSIRTLIESTMVTKNGGGSVRFDDDHIEIRAAIEAGDADAARDLMTAHLLRVRGDRLTSFSGNGPTPGGLA
ncbi:MAG: transcriptional regulator, GntR-family [Frankiales bacterium]|nr:transcriptional regulator, GntR-family [Frankiales bacterium]